MVRQLYQCLCYLSQLQVNLTYFSILQELVDSFLSENFEREVGKHAVAVASLSEDFNECFQNFIVIMKDMLLFSCLFTVAMDDT